VRLFTERVKEFKELEFERLSETLDEQVKKRAYRQGIFSDLYKWDLNREEISGQVRDVLSIRANFRKQGTTGIEYTGTFSFRNGSFALNRIRLRIPNKLVFKTKDFDSNFPWTVVNIDKHFNLGIHDFSITELSLTMGESEDYSKIRVSSDLSRRDLRLAPEFQSDNGFSFDPNISKEMNRRNGQLFYAEEVANWLIQNQIQETPEQEQTLVIA
jgi:hypothetical protein